MIDWDGDNITEPIITAEIGIYNIERIAAERLFIGKFRCHTQGIERTVKEVTRASKLVVVKERRDGVIKATIHSRAIHPKSNTKKDFYGFVRGADGLSSDED